MSTQFQEMFQRLKQEHGLTYVALGLKLGLDKSTVSRRVRGELAWTRQELETVCDLFHLTDEQTETFIQAGLTAYHRGEPISQPPLAPAASLQPDHQRAETVTAARHSNNRQKMLNLVESFWIKGVLDTSLHGTMLLKPTLKERPDVVHHPWNMRAYIPGQADRLLPSDTDLLDVFDEANQTLLILGQPGSGKTTLLLDLCCSLIDRARAEAIQPIPIVFNLSTWSDHHQSLEAWLVAEMKRQYTVAEGITRPWLADTALCLLLDGLDEVAPDRRAACVTAVNEYCLAHTFAPLILCSRSEEYEALPIRLHLTQAIAIQPLTPAQIEAYLAGTGAELEAVRHALQTDADLRELATTPLMLNLMSLAYRGKTLNDLRVLSTLEAHRTHILETYIEATFKRRPAWAIYPMRQVRHWLTWLACQMTERNLSLFLLEDLLPDWLPTHSQKWQYRGLVALAVGLSGGLIFGLIFGISEGVSEGIVAGVSSGLGAGLSAGLGTGVSTGANLKLGPATGTASWWAWLITKVKVGLTFGVIFGLSAAPSAALSMPQNPGLGLIMGLVGGLSLGMIGGVIWSLSLQLDHIEPVEYLGWSWPKFWRNLKIGLMFGIVMSLFIGLIVGVVFSLPDAVSAGVGWGLIVGLIGSVAGGLLGGLRGAPEVKGRTTPNQGIWLSARNGLKIGISVALISGLIVGVIVGGIVGLLGGLLGGLDAGLTWGLIGGWISGLIVGLLGGLGSGLSYGGLALLQHFITRFLLSVSNHIPYKYIPFLDYVTDRILLQRVGPGYRFIHRMVQDHLATQWQGKGD